MNGDPEAFLFYEQLCHEEVEITHHIDIFEAEMLVNSYRNRWIKKNEPISQPEEE